MCERFSHQYILLISFIAVHMDKGLFMERSICIQLAQSLPNFNKFYKFLIHLSHGAHLIDKTSQESSIVHLAISRSNMQDKFSLIKIQECGNQDGANERNRK